MRKAKMMKKLAKVVTEGVLAITVVSLASLMNVGLVSPHRVYASDVRIDVEASLFVINSPHSDACQTATCKTPLVGAEVRLFGRSGPSTPLGDLAVKFSDGTHLSDCSTDADGKCFLSVPSGGHYEVILKWRDPDTGGTIYSLSSVDGVFSTHANELQDQIIKLIQQDGSVQITPGRTQLLVG